MLMNTFNSSFSVVNCQSHPKMNNFLLCSVALLIYICITSAHNSSSTLENSKLVVDHGSPITKTKRESANNIQFKDSTNLDMAARPLRTKRYQGYQLGSYRRCGRSVRVKRFGFPFFGLPFFGGGGGCCCCCCCCCGGGFGWG
ncbi:hypothetical protein V3C99_012686 [Haemonchus contortus]